MERQLSSPGGRERGGGHITHLNFDTEQHKQCDCAKNAHYLANVYVDCKYVPHINKKMCLSVHRRHEESDLLVCGRSFLNFLSANNLELTANLQISKLPKYVVDSM